MNKLATIGFRNRQTACINLSPYRWVTVRMFNATFNNISVISWQSVLLVEETGVPRENTDLPQVTDKLYHIMLHPLSGIRTHNVSGDRYRFH